MFLKGVGNKNIFIMKANSTGFMAQELPEEEMKMLYRLLEPNVPVRKPKHKFRLWNFM